MRQDKDRGSKWLIAHHGDAILKLAGITGFTSWRAVQPETVAPRRLPDGLLEVQFAGESNPSLVLIEIESYSDADADRQIFEDVAIVFLERRRVPDVVSLVLKPKGNAQVSGTIQHVSLRNTTRIGGSWPVVQLWNLTAEQLLADGDAGLIPWVPLTRTDLPPETLLGRCAERLAGVPNDVERSGLLAVTQILAGLAFPKLRFGKILGGPQAMIESPVLDEALELMEKQVTAKVEARMAEIQKIVVAKIEAETRAKIEIEMKAEGYRNSLRAILDARFGTVPTETLEVIDDPLRLDFLLRYSATCGTYQDFLLALKPK